MFARYIKITMIVDKAAVVYASQIPTVKVKCASSNIGILNKQSLPYVMSTFKTNER